MRQVATELTSIARLILGIQKAMEGKEVAKLVAQSLAKAGMPRLSKYSGGEITGWTRSIGSTGFSLRDAKGNIEFNVVISGKNAGVKYEETSKGHEPVDAKKLCPKITAVFKRLGFKVKSCKATSWQLVFDDDIGYTVVTDWPEWVLPTN